MHNDLFKTFLFPDTDICRETRYPLLLVGAPLFYLQPVEPDPQRTAPSEPDLFMERGLCQAHTPAPLGADRGRFQRLIEDIRSRRDDYAAQLSALTMASLSAHKSEHIGEAGHQIVSSLLQQHRVVEPGDQQTIALELWQARLVLCIAELLEKEEEALRNELELLTDQELEMLRSLQGEDGLEEEGPLAELTALRTRLSVPRTGDFRVRFKAWQRLMRAGALPPVDLWLASSREAADQVFEPFADRHPGVALPLLSLPLPREIAASPSYLVDQVARFREQADPVLAAMCAELERFRTGDYPQQAAIDDLLPGRNLPSDEWQTLVDRHFPASSHGRSALVFYLLPGQAVPALLHIAPPVDADRRHGLLAVLQS
ncbi:hypothetical protein [Desulfofustis limnaeus]|uniref:Uncharacterized protein n=1 Tax=Desulfofustis limnaeus TaxID=2740163 RepID=A0ABM7W7A2_9BACT|nr:hypothetical protein [Desulfofustis limnaeus]BDD86780.1 hypothetical protein DPPLL_11450 [Desulfofustis limnaeus]